MVFGFWPGNPGLRSCVMYPEVTARTGMIPLGGNDRGTYPLRSVRAGL